jgi:hypothetical protein
MIKKFELRLNDSPDLNSKGIKIIIEIDQKNEEKYPDQASITLRRAIKNLIRASEGRFFHVIDLDNPHRNCCRNRDVFANELLLNWIETVLDFTWRLDDDLKTDDYFYQILEMRDLSSM